jgi:hypothetical protein
MGLLRLDQRFQVQKEFFGQHGEALSQKSDQAMPMKRCLRISTRRAQQ